MDDALRILVWQRAGGRCEYCLIPQAAIRIRHRIDHVIARQHGGPEYEQNLALICQHCNLHKGPNIAGIDPETGQLARLFDPRHDRWLDHFEWQGPKLAGRTNIGRTTTAVLAINEPLLLAVRLALMEEGQYLS